jgi:ribonuclease R
VDLLGKRDRPVLGRREIARRLALHPGQVRPLDTLLKRLETRGLVERQGGRFRARRGDDLVEGVLERGRDGLFGVRDGDRFLRLGELGDAQEGDRIRAQAFEAAGGAAAELVEVVAGARAQWVCRVARGQRGLALVPYRGRDTEALPVASRDLKGAELGEMVVAEVLSPSRKGRPAMSYRVVERLGFAGDPEADFRAVVWHRDLPTEFSRDALAEADALADGIVAEELQGRVDLRDRCFVTIDPASARDHDDAVFVEPAEGGCLRLWVAIADVSHFVREGSALDRGAWLRGNSIYFPGRSIPMLPERISSDLCSLRPDVDRLVLAAELEVDGEGSIRTAHFHEAVIRSQRRLSYQEAEAGMKSAEEGREADGFGSEISEQLGRLGIVADRLARQRALLLSLDFDLPQPEVILDDEGRPSDIRRAGRGPAHRAVEEAMLAANRAVAQALLDSSHPGVYRVHEAPAPLELAALGELYQTFGFSGSGRGKALDRAGMVKTLGEAEGRQQERVVHYSTLRAMKQARYAADSLGHFALGFDAYLHFTSPIRRYADLAVHRSLRQLLRRERGPRDGFEWASRIAIRTSARERLATTAERDMIGLARCAVMKERIGDEFEGTVTGVAEHGLYLTLDDPFVEGMVRISRLRGFFDYDRSRHRLVARGSRFQHRLGDRMKVVVASVNSQMGWIDLDPAPPGGEDAAPVGSGKPRKAEREGISKGKGRVRPKKKRSGRRR